MSRKGKKLGEILVEDGTLSEEQIEVALEMQRNTGEFLGHILLERRWVTESQLLQALSEQFDIPFVHLELEKVDWSVAMQYSSSLMREKLCMPLVQDTVSVTVAISDPLDAMTISELESQSRGRNVELVLATKEEIREAIDEYSRRSPE